MDADGRRWTQMIHEGGWLLTPVDFEKEIGVPNDLRQLKIIQ